jgi:hypothetical protein
MSKSPTSQTRFQIAVHEGYQFTERGFTHTKLLLSITDARRQWVGWYIFGERQIEVIAKAYDNILMHNKIRADKAIQFGDGPIDRAMIQTRHPRAVDRFGSGDKKPTVARLHDARFVSFNRLDGSGPADMMRLEMQMSIDLITRTQREIVHARMSMLSPARPDGNIHPAVGWLVMVGQQPFAQAQNGPSNNVMQAVESPI